ncbi:hypothetical protein GEMRC1_007059 [Eukaryota sp. GEM-RC1]
MRKDFEKSQNEFSNAMSVLKSKHVSEVEQLKNQINGLQSEKKLQQDNISNLIKENRRVMDLANEWKSKFAEVTDSVDVDDSLSSFDIPFSSQASSSSSHDVLSSLDIGDSLVGDELVDSIPSDASSSLSSVLSALKQYRPSP